MISQKKLRISSCGLQMNNVLTRVEIMNGAEAKALVDPFYVAVGKSHYQARNDDTFFILLDSANNNVIGTVRYCVEEGVSMLRSMNVHPDFRGKKLGELLLHAFENYLIKNNIKNTFCIPYGHLKRFYGTINFKTISDDEAPVFLQERINSYRLNYADKSFLLMRRAAKEPQI